MSNIANSTPALSKATHWLRYIGSLFIPVPLPPLCYPTACLIAGILAYSLPWYIAGGIALVPVAVSVLLYTRQRPLTLCIISILSLMLGYARVHYYSSTFNHFNECWHQQCVDIKATVVDAAVIPHMASPHQAVLQLHAIKKSNAAEWIPTHAQLIVYWRQRPYCTIGDTIVLQKVVYKKPSNNYGLYLLKEGNSGSLFLNTAWPRVIHHPPFCWQRTIARVRNSVFTQLQNSINPQTFALFASIFLGNKNAIKSDLAPYKQQFQAWGISHYLARSGLHLIIVTMIFMWLLRLIPFGIRTKRLMMVIIISIYYLLSWPSISFMRAFYTILLYCLCSLLALPLYTLHLFTFVCFLTLLLNPLQLFFLDFQLSFGLTGALAWYNQLTLQRSLQTQNY